MRKNLALAAALLLLLLPGLAIGQIPKVSPFNRPETLAYAGSIPLPNVHGRMDHMGVDVAGDRLFVAAYDNHTVEVVDLKTGKDVKSLPFNEPQNALYVPSVNRLFVSSSGDGTVKILNGTTFALEKTVQLPSDADNMRYDARRKHVLVDCCGAKFLHGKTVARRGEKNGAVVVLDLDGNIVGKIPTGGHPEALQPEQKGNRIFINVPDDHYIVVADLDTDKVLTQWVNPGCENYPMALDEAHHRDFVFCRNNSTIEVIDTETGEFLPSIAAATASQSDDMFFDPTNNRLYVLERSLIDPKNPYIPGPGMVDVIQEVDPNHYEKIENVTTTFAAQTGLLVPAMHKLFVSGPAQEATGQSARIQIYDLK